MTRLLRASMIAVLTTGMLFAEEKPVEKKWDEVQYVEGAGGSRAVRLDKGSFINMGSTPELDLPQASIEMIFRLDRAPGPGYTGYDPCLIAKRDGATTRFSLHVMHDLSQLVVWNGRAPAIFPAPGGKLAVGTWYHAVLTWQGNEMCLYLDGVSLGKAKGTFNTEATGLPLLIGASSLAGAEWCDCSVDEVSVYNRALTAEEASAHAAPLGKQLALAEQYAPVVAATPGLVAFWRMEENMDPTKGQAKGTFTADASRNPDRLSLLSSQLGYQAESGKRAYVRDLDRHKMEDGTEFTVHDSENDDIVYRAQTSYWGEKWKSHWWVLDFSALKTPGTYYLRMKTNKSNPFYIGKTPLMDYDMADIALNQLDERHNHGEPNTYLNGKLRFHGRWMTPDGKHPRGIYRDCMSNFAEIQAVGLTTMGLITLYRYQKDKFSEEDQKRIRDYITLGADYIVACQRKTDDPKTHGRFAHSLLVNTEHDGCGWAGNVYNWHDMAFAMIVLCKSYETVKPFDPARAQTYLDAATLAYTCASHRPYHLPEEYELAKRDDSYDPLKDYDKARWTPKLNAFRTDPAKIPVGWNNPHEYARLFYDKKAPWEEPLTLKTREKLPFLHGCALLYRITGEQKYLDTAVTFADSIQDRQFTDWRQPIEGVYGTFYEFEGDDEAFSIESGQAGGHFMGHIDALNVNGFMELVRSAPDHPNCAQWRNVIHTYAENYVRKSADLNPLGIHPLGVFSAPGYGGVKFFQQVMHGATGHYGQMAENILALADFLNDSSLHRLAEANVHFYTGLNPGIPQEKGGGWKAATLINKVGPSFYNTGGEGIKGGVINGFKAGQNWVLAPVSQVQDAPDIAGGQEDWVAHSHPYVGAAARLEAPFTLVVNTTDDGTPVAATVRLQLPEAYTYQAGPRGTVTITDVPSNREGVLSVRYGEQFFSRKIDTIAGGSLTWAVDFAQHAEVSLDVPEKLGLDAEGQAMIKVSNLGSKPMAGKVLLSASGAALETSALGIKLDPGESKKFPVGCRGGDRVMPYLIYAALKTDRGIVATSSRQGLVGSE